MVSDIEDIYQAFINSGMTESEIEHHVKKKAEALGGFMSTNAILFILAKEMGLKIKNSVSNNEDLDTIEEDVDYDDFNIDVSEIEEGMSNMVITGRIENIFPIREFIRKDGTNGIVGSFLICDGTGNIKIVIWDSQVDVMKSEFFTFNTIVRIINGYSKKGIKDQLEIHLGKKGRIILAPPQNKRSKKIPELSQDCSNPSYSSSKTLKISEIFEMEGFLPFISGTIHVEEFSEKNLKNGEKSFLLRFFISDNSDRIEVVVWGIPAVNCFKLINNGDKVKISNVIVKVNSYTNLKQIYFTKKTKLESE